MTSGRFITFEGGEGAGKSTQVRRLVAALAAAGIDARATREPGGAPGAERIRTRLVEGATHACDPLTEALLHYAARREHLARTVLPAIGEGSWVVSDRFADSTMAYQAYGQNVPAAAIEALYGLVVGPHGPDLTIILDLPVATGLERAAARAGVVQRYERMGAAFHERLRAGFLDIARREPARCVVLEASADVDAVHAAVLAAVRERLGAPV